MLLTLQICFCILSRIMTDQTKPAKKKRIAAHSPLTKIKALELYLYSSLTLREIAKQVKVPDGTLRSWYQFEKWPAQRRALQKDLQDRLHEETARIIRENRAAVMKRHIKVGGKLEDQIEKVLDKAVEKGDLFKSEDLLNLGRALQSSGKVTGAAVGIDHRNQSDASSPVNILIHTGMSPRPAEDPEPVTVDVPVEDSEPLPDASEFQLSESDESELDDFDLVELDEPDPF